MPDPVTRTMLSAGRPDGPGSRSSGMITNVPPPGSAGVSSRVPATRTVNGPAGTPDVSWVAPWPRTAAASGEASTGTGGPEDRTPPGAAPIAVAGKAGNGVLATSAA